jgi:pyruvate dehydrogenase E2 component (dihydrolipoamide acetyltransferase)
VNIGLAVAIDDGLVTPVIHNAAHLTMIEFSQQRRLLVDKALAGRLEMDDMTNGTFTITNLGSESIRFFTPIINPPQAAILGVGQITPAAAVVEGRLEVRPMMGLSLTFDHRIVDGLPAARFLARIKDLLEDPAGLTGLS